MAGSFFRWTRRLDARVLPTPPSTPPSGSQRRLGLAFAAVIAIVNAVVEITTSNLSWRWIALWSGLGVVTVGAVWLGGRPTR